MDSKPGVDHLYRLAGEHLQYLFSRHGPGKGKIRVPVRGVVEFQFDSFLPVMGLHGFKGGAADALVAVEAEGPRVPDTVYPPVLRNERPPGAIVLQRASMKQEVFPLARTTSTPSSTSDRIHSIAPVSILRVGSVIVPSTSVRIAFSTV